MASYNSVAVIGAGAWGTALASVAARAGRDVGLYARNSAKAAQIASTRENPKLAGVRLEAGVDVTGDIAVAARSDIILIAVPSQNLREAVTALAIAAGIVVGRKLGASAQAALTTRGFSELMRLGRACGARSETLAGLSGLGDLILTCGSAQSRNLALGIALGRGERPSHDKLAEGEFTAPVLIELAASQNVDMPVSNAVAAILSGAVTIDEAIESLLTRPFKADG